MLVITSSGPVCRCGDAGAGARLMRSCVCMHLASPSPWRRTHGTCRRSPPRAALASRLTAIAHVARACAGFFFAKWRVGSFRKAGGARPSPIECDPCVPCRPPGRVEPSSVEVVVVGRRGVAWLRGGSGAEQKIKQLMAREQLFDQLKSTNQTVPSSVDRRLMPRLIEVLLTPPPLGVHTWSRKERRGLHLCRARLGGCFYCSHPPDADTSPLPGENQRHLER